MNEIRQNNRNWENSTNGSSPAQIPFWPFARVHGTSGCSVQIERIYEINDHLTSVLYGGRQIKQGGVNLLPISLDLLNIKKTPNYK